MCSIIVTIKQKVLATKNKVSKNAIAKEDTMMLKKFLGIFKRDKSGFSDEELKWQAKIGGNIKNTLSVILWVGSVIINCLLLTSLVNFFYKTTIYIAIILIIVLWIVGSTIVLIIKEVILNITSRAFKLAEINAQLQKNSNENQIRELLSYIKERDFSKVGIQLKMIDPLFRMFVKSGILEIKPDDNTIEVSLSKPIKDVESFVIKKEDLLTYFDFEIRR